MFDVKGRLSHVVLILLDTTTSFEQQEAIRHNSETMRGVAASVLDLLNAANAACEQLVSVLVKTDSATEETAGRMLETLTAMEQMNMAVLDISKNAATPRPAPRICAIPQPTARALSSKWSPPLTKCRKNSIDLQRGHGKTE